MKNKKIKIICVCAVAVFLAAGCVSVVKKKPAIVKETPVATSVPTEVIRNDTSPTSAVPSVSATTGITVKSEVATQTVKTPPVIGPKNPVTKKGKRLIYIVAWNGIPVGRVIAEILPAIEYEGRMVRVLKVRTESNEFLSRIYRVDDVYLSYFDEEKLISRYYEADRKEGFYRKHVVVTYDMKSLRARYHNHTDGSVKYCDIKEKVQDPLSVIYYFMNIPVKLDDNINVTINLNEKNYELFGKIESVDILTLPKIGDISAYKVRPYAVLNGQRYRRGYAYIYFSVGKERYPVYCVAWIPFGKVTGTLLSVEEI
ncbi:MAG TPA: DUF3108 domain-containing protein [Candidatus Omnitrophota bacterium]|nr:DUF3108 domain-containing protein [Candidatus Omnitrophota bacterium]HPS20190.1 DUF3108 domain-containing protein [Candidatus Omnitrophota bacterium]